MGGPLRNDERGTGHCGREPVRRNRFSLLDSHRGYRSRGVWYEYAASALVQFGDMAGRHLDGSADWAEYGIALPLDPTARQLMFGVQLAGTGRLWVDDLQLFVDDVPVTLPETVLDRDTSMVASSRVTLERPMRTQVENLVLLGKVWGFLKYHHPAVVRGERQWDFDLFRVTPRVLAANDAAGAQRAISAWIDSLGPVPACTSCVKLPEGLALAPRLGWIKDRALLGPGLSAQLTQIRERRPDVSSQFYVALSPGVGNPDFSAELDYPRQRDPDPGYRLLALFRFWNMVEYWFPYRDLIDGDWDACLREFATRLLGAKSHDAYAREMMALIARISDTHANLISSLQLQPPGGSAALPVTLRFIERRAMVVAYANPRLGPASGLKIGDIVSTIDGVPVDALVTRWRPMFAVSNDATRQRDMARALGRGEPGRARLTVLRGTDKLGLNVERVPRDSLDRALVPRDPLDRARERVHDHPGPPFRQLSDELVYLKLSTARLDEVSRYLDGMRGAKCIVIDIRNYPGDPVGFALEGNLVKTTTPFARFTVGDVDNPGSFSMGTVASIRPSDPYVEGAVALLVDEVTQSQAEFTAMALRTRPGAIVVGSQTAGADGNVSRIPLPGGEWTRFSGIGVFYPDGRPTQRVGIVPDLEVRPTIAGTRAGRDEVLEAAVRRLLGRDISPGELKALAAPGDEPGR